MLNGCAREETRTPDEIDALRATDPKLVKYREVDRIETGFTEARGLAAGPEDTLYVAGDTEVRAFDAKGARLASYALSAPPQCIALGPEQTLYAGLPDCVAVAPHGGPFKQQWEPIRPKALLTSLAFGGEAVYVANSAARVVLRYDRTGRLLGRLGEKDPATGYPGLILPSPYLRVCLSKEGMIHLNNTGMHRIETWTPEGKLKGAWGVEGSEIEKFCGCCNPIGLALLPDGRFVTSEKGLTRIKVYDRHGRFVCVVAPPDAFAHNTFDIPLATDSRGRVLALDTKARAVRVFAPV